ncbi:hypothetical protein SAMN04487898_104121 [Pedobacter sp. ok626]|uniref:hypothetical protein n=1 Tax=Pedobacter sp. ok626 TaxID=1761882 RepID=UPI0008912951|nr:hypothetical protein [Pedobacter sp. ok626]SDJ73185.1 hypothetical protein SAMN04487898_104121 [Pedobacter sp. ok626]
MKYIKIKTPQIRMTFALMTLVLISGCKSGLSMDNSAKENEQASLLKLMDEIVVLSKKVNCEDAKEWKFMPIGAKACGGPAGYISYSIKIDTDDFIKKVGVYTVESENFNKKWGIISDCMAVNPPKEIKCENGKPIFVY